MGNKQSLDGAGVFRVYLIEDHTLFREMVAMQLKDNPTFQLVGQSGDGLEGLEQCRALRPDILVLDIQVPGMLGTQIAKTLINEIPSLRILALTSCTQNSTYDDLLAAGVHGYLPKDAPLSVLLEAFREFSHGNTFYFSRRATQPTHHDTTLSLLSEREVSVLKLFAEGHSTKIIADKLGICSKTCSNHMTHIKDKLRAHDASALVRLAMRCGLVDEVKE